ncbi:FadR/GntR family transcriptional regulator [Sporosarcina limicola]|uniref:DNA-binding FadR family transcriptional regulator n=1 Tax=Sporosarcina limicola TaxID=34101 RepID=A0A927MTK6_9BACL|nr:FadR/GntR family transcriptional regulator [Sporosarcina limicola]MBE1557111.1 DNA-binding FadR family transcriptional regulator [Sporosarcina limicola]
MNIMKTNRTSLVEQVATQMENLIETGHWSIGDKIPPEMELMVQFDVSRNTLREAIRALVHAGLLETKQGSGTSVRSASALGFAIQRHVEKSSLIDTLEVRLALEREAAQMAAERRDDRDIEKLKGCFLACQKAAATANLDQFVDADILFHKAIVEASHNQVLIDLYEHMTDALYSSVRDLIILHAPFNYEEELHVELYEAILERDINRAREYVNSYSNEFKKALTSMTEE